MFNFMYVIFMLSLIFKLDNLLYDRVFNTYGDLGVLVTCFTHPRVSYNICSDKHSTSARASYPNTYSLRGLFK